MQIVPSIISLFIIFFFIKIKNTPKTELLERIRKKVRYPAAAERIILQLGAKRVQLNILQEDIACLETLERLLDYYLLNCPDRVFFHGKGLQKSLRQIINDINSKNQQIKVKPGANKRIKSSFLEKEKLENRKAITAKIEQSILDYYYLEELLSGEIVLPFFLWNAYQKFRLFLRPRLFDFIKKVRIFVYRKKDLLRPFFRD